MRRKTNEFGKEMKFPSQSSDRYRKPDSTLGLRASGRDVRLLLDPSLLLDNDGFGVSLVSSFDC